METISSLMVTVIIVGYTDIMSGIVTRKMGKIMGNVTTIVATIAGSMGHNCMKIK